MAKHQNHLGSPVKLLPVGTNIPKAGILVRLPLSCEKNSARSHTQYANETGWQRPVHLEAEGEPVGFLIGKSRRHMHSRPIGNGARTRALSQII